MVMRVGTTTPFILVICLSCTRFTPLVQVHITGGKSRLIWHDQSVDLRIVCCVRALGQ